jgi:hypothetical protein
MRSSQKGRWQGVRRVAWRATRKERNEVKTSSLDLDSRLALHPKQGKLALAPIYEMSSSMFESIKRIQAGQARCKIASCKCASSVPAGKLP